jgi:hypothetical protein
MYVVERHLPGITMPELAALQRAEERACEVSVAQGKPVRFVRSTFAPGESRCQCLFEAPNADVVQEVNDLAQIPYSRIILVVDSTGERRNDMTRGGEDQVFESGRKT